MHILVTNDDGVTAPGLAALAQEMKLLGKVTVLAPDHNWSASGHVKTLNRPLRVKELPAWDGVQVFASDGAPSDCVALAVLGLLSEKIDLVVSGINPNANLGHDVTYSGTVTAAMEAAISEIPGIAVSLDAPENHLGAIDYGPAARIGRQVVTQVIGNGLAQATLLNVNVPYLPYEQIKGILFTRQGMRVYRDALVARNDPRGRPYYWIGGEAPTGIPDEGTDFGALARGFVSITPLQMDMTAYRVMDNLRAWKFE
jgi:5'-nucleotidase